MFDIDLFDVIARALVLLLAMPVHEFSHAAMAVRLGDDTPINQGRYTLNPFSHLSLMGSLMLMLAGFGWAKPVMVDMHNLKSPKRDMALVAVMGPLANIFMAFLLLCVFKIALGFYGAPVLEDDISPLYLILLYAVIINLTLAVFNLLPIPPLDGSKILAVFLPDRYYGKLIRYEQAVMLVLIFLMFTGRLSGPISFLRDSLFDLLWWVTTPIDLLF